MEFRTIGGFNVWPTLSAELGKVKSDDPIAFTAGINDGKCGRKLPRKRSQCASEYLRGYKIGKDLATGKTTAIPAGVSIPDSD